MLKTTLFTILFATALFGCSSNSPANEKQDERDTNLKEKFSSFVDSTQVWADDQTVKWSEVDAQYQELSEQFRLRADSMDTMTKQGIEKLQRKYGKIKGQVEGRTQAMNSQLTILVNDLTAYMDSLKQDSKARIDKLGDEAKQDLLKKKTYIEENYETLEDSTQAKYDVLKEELEKLRL